MNRLFTIAFLMVLSAASFADVWTDRGLTVLSNETAGPTNTFFLKSSKGLDFRVDALFTVSPVNAVRIQAFVNEFESWQDLDIASLRFFLGAQRMEILLIPSRFDIKGTNYAQYIPAGLYFYYEGSIRYDFRMNLDRYFMRIKGLFVDRDELTGKMAQAIQNPAAYIQLTEPEMIFNRLAELEDSVYQLKRENEKLKTALMNLMNRDFFGTVVPLKPEVISRLIELRKTNPGWKKNDYVKALSAEKINVSDWEVYLVLAVLYGEF